MNCKKCYAYIVESGATTMCMAPACIKKYDYDPETKTWTKKRKFGVIALLETVLVLYLLSVITAIVLWCA